MIPSKLGTRKITSITTIIKNCVGVSANAIKIQKKKL